jgi:protein TonB
MIDSSIYDKGIKYSYAKFDYHVNKRKSTYQYTDSLKNTYYYITFDSTGKKVSEASFVDNNGVYNVYDSTGKVNSTNVFTRKLIEAECKSYLKHLQQHLNGDIGRENGARPGQYSVVIKFIINIDGSVSNLEAETNFGHKMEEEAMRVIKNSPKWVPASLFGIPVKSIKRQPITFFISADR